MIKYSFTKMNGAGNDFIMVNLDTYPDLQLSTEIVAKACDRRFGIGADGLISVRRSSGKDFVMQYFNSDGSSGMLCGNGARCAIKFAWLQGMFQGNSVHFSNAGVDFKGELIEGGLIRFFLPLPDTRLETWPLSFEGKTFTGYRVDTGTRHLVIELDASDNEEVLEQFPVELTGRYFRYLPEFAPQGTNVNFIVKKDNKLVIRTYEKGVEAETGACGTGAVASAITAVRLGLLMPPVVLQTRSGKELLVDFKLSGEDITDVSLAGPAEVNFGGEYSF